MTWDHDPALLPVCRHCHRAIWLHVYGGEGIWRHFNGLMLCQPDLDAPDSNEYLGATPMTSEEYKQVREGFVRQHTKHDFEPDDETEFCRYCRARHG